METTFPFEPCVVEATAIEIGSVVSCEEGPVVLVVNKVTEVAIPGRVVIIGKPGEIGFTDDFRSAHICILINDGGWCRRNIHPRSGYTKTDTCVYVYL